MPLHLDDLVAIGAESVRRYRLRAAQTAAGVVAGVAAVVAAASLNKSAQAKALAEIDLLGPENIIIQATGTSHSRRPLSWRDAEALGRALPEIAAPVVTVSRRAFIAGTAAAHEIELVGATPRFAALIHARVAAGRSFNIADERGRARVCMLGAVLARSLFGYRRAVGERVRIDGDWFSVIGVFDDRGAGASRLKTAAANLDRAAVVPFAVATVRPPWIDPSVPVDEIWIDAGDAARVSLVARVVQRSLARMLGPQLETEALVPRELLRQRNRVARVFGAGAVAVGALLLIVGGFGISNAMFASVVARRREIGIRRTVGATRRDIAAQFLLEAAAITAVGGATGVFVGLVASWIIAVKMGWPAALPVASMLLAFVVSLVTGLLAGVQPARRAAAVEPIDAVMAE